MAELNTNVQRKTKNKSSVYDHSPPSIHVSKTYLATKRLMDIIGAITGLILTSPLFLLISVLYLVGQSKGPVFFKQTRIGKGGKRFRIYKFRSMLVNAEQKLKEDQRLYYKYLKNDYKLEPEEDPRITNVGRFLRRTSLDELPQLINVLIGDMSLVGPRPVVEEELKEYGTYKKSFLSAKPGVTGYWQVSGRSEIGYPERVDLELYYIMNQSFLFDITIILKTFWIILIKRGAY